MEVLGVVVALQGAGVASIRYTFLGILSNFEMDAALMGRLCLLRRSFFLRPLFVGV